MKKLSRKLRMIWWIIRSDAWIVAAKRKDKSGLCMDCGARFIDDTIIRICEFAHTQDQQDAAVDTVKDILNNKL